MADERLLVITPKDVGVDCQNVPDPSILLTLDVSDAETGLAPGLLLAVRMSPAEGRQFARAILRKADEAEAGLSRA